MLLEAETTENTLVTARHGEWGAESLPSHACLML